MLLVHPLSTFNHRNANAGKNQKAIEKGMSSSLYENDLI